MTETAYLVRHGKYARNPLEALTDTGREQSKAARDFLIARQLGGRAYLGGVLERACFQSTASQAGDGPVAFAYFWPGKSRVLSALVKALLTFGIK
jgi:hypothetical protein